MTLLIMFFPIKRFLSWLLGYHSVLPLRRALSGSFASCFSTSWLLNTDMPKDSALGLLFPLYIHSLGDLIQSHGYKIFLMIKPLAFLSPTLTYSLNPRLLYPSVHSTLPLACLRSYSWKTGDPGELVCSSSLKSWESGGLVVEVLVQKPAGSRPSKSQCFSLKAKQKYCPGSSNLARQERGSAVLFYSGLQLIEWGSLTLGRVICFIPSTDSNDNLIRNTLTDTKNNVWPDVPAPCGPVKLTHKINHRSCPEKSLRVVLDFSLVLHIKSISKP